MTHRITHGRVPAPPSPQKPAATKTSANGPFQNVMAKVIGANASGTRIPSATTPLSTTPQSTAPLLTTPQSAPTPASTQPTLYQTPFGSVLVDPNSTTNLQGLFSNNSGNNLSPKTTGPQLVAQEPVPTPESVFGPNPWVNSASYTGPQNKLYGYNPIYFASPQTAAKVAAMLGGVVVQKNMMASLGAFQQQEPNNMVLLPNGKLINPGLVADFYNHGYPQSYVDYMIQCEVKNT